MNLDELDMRNLVIYLICNSRRWQGVIEIGEAENLPVLTWLTDLELLEAYDYYVGEFL